jgi:acetolactate synthase I/III small subunit
MKDQTVTFDRTGHSDIPEAQTRAHTLIVLVHDRPGAIDRVVGMMRRRRANMQGLVLGRSESQDFVRITLVVNDSEVAVDHLIEQLRKLVDVSQVTNLITQQTLMRELALIKVDNATNATEGPGEIIELGDLFGAHAIDFDQETVTLEVTGSQEKIDNFVSRLQKYGIREVARSGSIVLARDVVENN